MNRSLHYALLLVVPIALVWGGCEKPGGQPANNAGGNAVAPSPFAGVNDAVCVINATEGNTITGTVHFTQAGGKVKVVADLQGLAPDSKHGFHIHALGDISKPDGTGTGGHYNPGGKPHALPPAAERHAGDLGNVTADAAGKAHLEIEVDNISIAGPANPVLGRAIIVHAKQDDGGQPTGNAGARIGQGVIGIAKPAG